MANHLQNHMLDCLTQAKGVISHAHDSSAVFLRMTIMLFSTSKDEWSQQKQNKTLIFNIRYIDVGVSKWYIHWSIWCIYCKQYWDIKGHECWSHSYPPGINNNVFVLLQMRAHIFLIGNLKFCPTTPCSFGDKTENVKFNLVVYQ